MPKKIREIGKKLEEEKIEYKKISKEDFEKKVVELAKSGLTSERIGETLREEGIHPKDYDKISKVLKKNESYINPDVRNAKRKLENLEKHYSKNKQDKKALKEREKVSGNLRKLMKYYEKD